MVGGELTECLCDWRNNSIKREETEDIGETIAGMMSSGKWSKEKIDCSSISSGTLLFTVTGREGRICGYRCW